MHRLWRLLPMRARRDVLARLGAAVAPRPDRDPPTPQGGVVVAGEIHRASGLGEGARLMRHALDGLGVPNWGVQAGLVAAGENAALAVDTDAQPDWPAHAPIVVHVNAPQMPLALARLPRALVRGRYVIGYWAWELPVAPKNWQYAARFAHEIWVPSPFTAQALANVYPGPIRVVPHAVACHPPQPAALDRQAFGLPMEAVVTLVSFSLASSFERKNPLGAIAAHKAAFGERPDRILVLKLAHGAHYPQDLARLQAAIGGAANIRLETRTLPTADAHALTRCSDIVLSLHRSEGFGLVPAEAMALGVPVVVTGWSGNMAYMDETCAALVGYQLVPAHDPRGVFEAQGAVWAQADLAQAVAHLQRLAEDAQARKALGQAGQQAVHQRLKANDLQAALKNLGMRLGM